MRLAASNLSLSSNNNNNASNLGGGNFSFYFIFLLSPIIAVGELLLILSMITLLTELLEKPLWHIARESSSQMLANTVLTGSQLGMAKPGFEHTSLWLDI